MQHVGASEYLPGNCRVFVKLGAVWSRQSMRNAVCIPGISEAGKFAKSDYNTKK